MGVIIINEFYVEYFYQMGYGRNYDQVFSCNKWDMNGSDEWLSSMDLYITIGKMNGKMSDYYKFFVYI